MKKILTLVLVSFLLTQFIFSESPAVRIKDIATIKGVRSNQLVGFGLVVGLRGTGDTTKSIFTHKAFTNMLQNMGLSRDDEMFKSRNVAAVMVTAELPPFVKPGQKIDLIVSSVGDATSLKGGTLIQTPLKGADDIVYVVAQGQMVVNTSEYSRNRKDNVETVGRIVAGGIVEKEVAIALYEKNNLKIVINKPDFSTALRLADSLDRGGYAGAKADDAATITVPLTVEDKSNIVAFISQLEDFLVVPDNIAKVVIDEKTGTIVIGENVRLSPVAISHAYFDIQIGDDLMAGATSQLLPGAGESAAGTENAEAKAKLVHIDSGSNLSSLVNALNALGASPKDLVAIIQTLKQSGALTAEVEVI